jgi:hypothetical protein
MTMSILDKHRDALEPSELMRGPARGRLAVALDLLTDALASVGQHGVYCQSARMPGQLKPDLRMAFEHIEDAKQLIQSAMEAIRADPVGGVRS